MKVITNNKQIALEVISAQNLFNNLRPILNEIKIKGICSHKYGLNDYDAMVTVGDVEIILFRDMNFKNVNLVDIFSKGVSEIEFIIEK